MQITCPCGNAMDVGLDYDEPTPDIGLLINLQTAHEIDRACTTIDQVDVGGLTRDTLEAASREVRECGVCGRLAISYPDKDGDTYKWYAPENGVKGGVLE